VKTLDLTGSNLKEKKVFQLVAFKIGPIKSHRQTNRGMKDGNNNSSLNPNCIFLFVSGNGV
jgi:hypothetical protein